MPKPILIIQLRPEDDTANNELEAICRYGGIRDGEFERIRAEQAGLPDIELDQYAAIIVGGSPFDVSTPEDEKSAIQKKVEADFRRLFDDIVNQDFPFLGACSGNGLLGSYCGARISRRFGEPVGAKTVTITAEGAEDPLLQGMPEKIRVLLGHKEACDELPQDAVLLIRGDDCPVQMFRVKSNVYAMQFHPEGDPEGFALRINAYRQHGYFPPEEANVLIENLAEEHVPESNEILRRFVSRYVNHNTTIT